MSSVSQAAGRPGATLPWMRRSLSSWLRADWLWISPTAGFYRAQEDAPQRTDDVSAATAAGATARDLPFAIAPGRED